MKFPLATAKARAELVDDAIVFDLGNRRLVVGGPFAPLLFTAVLPLLSGDISAEEVIRSVSDRLEPEVVDEFITLLAEKQIVFDRASDPPALKFSIESQAAKEFLVSKQIGLIRSISLVSKVQGEPQMPIFCQATLGAVPGGVHKSAGIGKGNTESEAFAAAAAEAMERYCALCPNKSQLVFAKRPQLDSQSIDPREFILYSKEQYALRGFPYSPFDEDRPILWHRAVEIRDDQKCLIPAQLVNLRMDRSAADDRLVPMTSNGLAAGATVQEAILGGILEVIERDSLLINWMNSRICDQITLGEERSVEREIIDHYRENNVLVKIFHMKSDIPAYAMMAVAFSSDGRPPFATVGMGCSLDPAEAARRALFELCQVRHGEIWRLKSRAIQKPLVPEHIVAPEDHSGFYSSVQLPRAFEFLERGILRSIEQLPSYSCGNIEKNLKHLVDSLYVRKMRVFYVDLTLPELTDIEISVVRVVVSGLQPIHFGFGMERLGGTRLLSAHSNSRPGQTNFFPHPLG